MNCFPSFSIVKSVLSLKFINDGLTFEPRWLLLLIQQ